MKKLSATEIKGIIEEKRSGVFEASIKVPSNFFSLSLGEQRRIVSMGVVGYQSDVVKKCEFWGVIKDTNVIGVRATLEFNDEEVEMLRSFEEAQPVYSENAIELAEPISISKATELSQQGLNTFVLAFPSHFLQRVEDLQRAFISRAVIGKDGLKDFFFKVVEFIEEGDNKVMVEVFIPNFAEQINELIQEESSIKEYLSELGVEGTVRLTGPLTHNYMYNVVANAGFTTGEITHDFKFLIEVDYSQLLELDPDYSGQFYEKYVLGNLVHEYDVEIEDYDHNAIGFNRFTKKVVVLFEGKLVLNAQ